MQRITKMDKGAFMKNSILKKCLIYGLFTIYCLALIYVLLIHGRHKIYDMPLLEYIRLSVNFIPFRTMTKYIKNVHTGFINVNTIIYNLIGNFLLFLPMGFLLPLTFRNLNTLFSCTSIVFVSILLLEILQLFLQIGVFDIDDFILNMLGAWVGYGIQKIKPIQALCTDLEYNEEK